MTITFTKKINQKNLKEFGLELILGDTGSWTATIDATGKATGTLTSTTDPSLNFVVTGEVSENGILNATYNYGTIEVGTMTGTLTEKTGSGTWESPLQELDGTWTGAKN